MLNKNILYFTLLIGIGFGTFYLTLSSVQEIKAGQVEVDVVPKDAKIRIGEYNGKRGVNNVPHGKYIIEASKDGFTTETSLVNTDESNIAYAGLVLKPNNQKTNDWYKKNPRDSKLAEAISSKNFDYNTSVNDQENTLLQLLPVTISDSQYSLIDIDYGKPQEATGEPAIYVTAKTTLGRQAALKWIRDKGYDPSMMDIIFYNELNYFDQDIGE